MVAHSMRWVAGIVLALLFIFGTSSAASPYSTSSPWSLEALKIEGEVYVKASSLLEMAGGTGIFDENKNVFIYQPESALPQIVEKASQSVVAIIGKPTVSTYQPIDRFTLAHGTGVIVSSDGWIVTNAHVIEEMKDIIVLTHDEKKYSVVKALKDVESDLALVKIEAKNLQPASFASSEQVEVGETVIAIGTPISFSLKNSASAGIISGTNRAGHSPYRLLQTDAAINPGNSGGPLVNMDGHVIGINTMKFVAVGIDNMGFSIPSDTVEYIIEHLLTYGHVKRPYIGFELEESWEAVIGLSSDKPMSVKRVEPNSIAAKLGIFPGDLLYSIEKENISTLIDLNEELKRYLPGDQVTITLQSKGDIVHKTITLQERK